MLGWLSEKLETRALQKQQLAQVKQYVRARFEGRVYIFPWQLRDTELGSEPAFKEDDWDRWEVIMLNFPDEPLSQKEAVENERIFWEIQVSRNAVRSYGAPPELIKHSDIRIFYQSNEKWLLREYFAATGKIIDPLIKEAARIVKLDKEAVEISIWWDSDGEMERKSRKIAKFNSESEQFTLHTAPAHWEKWGNWYVSHVAEAYRQAYEKPPSNDTGDRGFASPADVRRLGQGQPLRPAAQDQRFID